MVIVLNTSDTIITGMFIPYIQVINMSIGFFFGERG
jgi:hypothetical protein